MTICTTRQYDDNEHRNSVSSIRRPTSLALAPSVFPATAEFCRVSLPSATIVHNNTTPALSGSYGDRFGPTVLVGGDGQPLFKNAAESPLDLFKSLDKRPSNLKKNYGTPHKALVAWNHVADTNDRHSYDKFQLHHIYSFVDCGRYPIFKNETTKKLEGEQMDADNVVPLDPSHKNFVMDNKMDWSNSIESIAATVSLESKYEVSDTVDNAEPIMTVDKTLTLAAEEEKRPPSANGRFTIIDEQFKEITDDSFDESESDEFPETHLSKSASGCSLSIRFSRARNFADNRVCSSLTKCQSRALRRELFKNSVSASNLQRLFANHSSSLRLSNPIGKTMNVVERFKVTSVSNTYKLGRWVCRDQYDSGRAASIPETAELGNSDRAPMIGERPKSGSMPPPKRSVVFRVNSTRSDFFTPHASGKKGSAHHGAVPMAIVTPPSVTNARNVAMKSAAPASHAVISTATMPTNSVQTKQQPATITYHTPQVQQQPQFPAQQPESPKNTLPPPSRPVVFGISAGNSSGSSLDRMEHYYNLRGEPQRLQNLPPHSPVCCTPSSTSSLRMEEEPNRFTFNEHATAVHNEELQAKIQNQLSYLIQQQHQAYRQNSTIGYSRQSSSLRDLLSNFPTSTGPGTTAGPHGIQRKIGSYNNVYAPSSSQLQYAQPQGLYDPVNRQPLNYYDVGSLLHATPMTPTPTATSAVQYIRSPSSPSMSRGNSMVEPAPPTLTTAQHAPPLRARGFSDSRAATCYYRCNSGASGASECDSECDSDIFDIPNYHLTMQPHLQQQQQRHAMFPPFGQQHHLLQPQQQHYGGNGRLTPSMKFSSRMG